MIEKKNIDGKEFTTITDSNIEKEYWIRKISDAAKAHPWKPNMDEEKLNLLYRVLVDKPHLWRTIRDEISMLIDNYLNGFYD